MRIKMSNKLFALLLPIGVLVGYVVTTLLFGLVMATSIQAQFMSDLLWLLLGVGCWFYQRYTEKKEHCNRREFRPRPWAVFLLILVCMFFGVVIPLIGFGLQTHLPNFGAKAYQESVSQDAGLFLLMSVFLAPVVEEILFRWFMYKPWKKVLGLLPAMLLVNVIFAVIHGTLQHLPVAFFVGMCGCVLIEMTGRLRYAVLNHFIYNLLAVAFVPAILPEAGSIWYSIPVMILLYLVCFVVLFLLYRYRKVIRNYVTSDHLIDKWNRKWDEEVNK